MTVFIEREGIIDKIFDRVMAFSGYKDIDFDLDTDFSKRYFLMGEDEAEIRALFIPKLIEFIEKEQIHHIECNSEALLVFNKFELARINQVEKTIDFSRRLTERILA